MHFTIDLAQYLLAWTLCGFFLSGMLLLACSWLQIRRGNSDLAGYQVAAKFGALKQSPLCTPLAMFSVLPLPLPVALLNDEEMQVVEGEYIG